MDIPFRDPEALVAFTRPFLAGKAHPATAAELMASRYVAYATGAVDYLIESQDPKTRATVDRKATEAWSKDSEWLGLEIVRTDKGGPDDETGEVEFIARYRRNGTEHAHHELAQFRRLEGRWVFTDGEPIAPPPMRRTTPKVGRNDPCPCGSGKKYKKCCG